MSKVSSVYMNQSWINPYLGGYLMSKSNTSKPLAQVRPGPLHAGVDLALEKNVVVVINDQAQQLDQFSFSSAMTDSLVSLSEAPYLLSIKISRTRFCCHLPGRCRRSKALPVGRSMGQAGRHPTRSSNLG